MNKVVTFLLSCVAIIVVIGSCSSSDNPEEGTETIIDVSEQMSADLICFNHSLLFVDSTIYEAAVNSEFISHFAFSEEKHLTGYHGFYLVGKSNYIELFHPNSMDDEMNEPGTIWICLASLKANYLKKLNSEKLDFITFESDDYFNELSLLVEDSIMPITTREMRKSLYEGWAKKKYHDSVTFLPVDYNSPEESDSSSNYLMKDVNGIGVSLNPADNSKVIRYLKEIGYNSVSEFNGLTRLSNNEQFFELHPSENHNSLSINRYYIQLNQSVERSTEIIGNSRIECDGKSAIWIFEL